jgi:hypothetical protein
MDPVTLAATTVSLIAGYVSRHQTQLVDQVGDAVVGRLGALHDWVRGLLRRQPGAGAALERLEEEPADARRQGMVEFALSQLIERDDVLARELTDLVAAVDEQRPGAVAQITQITQSGAVAVGGDVRMKGTYVAGRDLTVGPQAPAPGAGAPPDPA